MESRIIAIDRLNYHVFRWICRSEGVDDLIEEAFDTAEDSSSYDLSDGSVRSAVYPRLVELLDDCLELLFEEWFSIITCERYVASECVVLLSDDDSESYPLDFMDLFAPLVRAVREEISPAVIAEALLKMKGKWHNRGPRPKAV